MSQSKRVIAWSAALLGVLLFESTSARALERPTRGAGAPSQLQLSAARAGRNHQVAPQLARQMSVKLEILKSGAPRLQPLGLPGPGPGTGGSPAPIPDNWSTLPSTGTRNVLALLIDFQDYPASVPTSTVEDMLFGAGDAANFPRESLTAYYERSSYGQLHLKGNVLGWYTAGKRSTVMETGAGREDLIKQALNSFEAAGHDFTQYDNDGDGVIDYLIVMWTGPIGAWASFWWGWDLGWGDSTYKLDGKRIANYSWQWEADEPSVVIHETGHALGLPDYYDYDGSVGPDGGLGGHDMMDANRGDHNCFSKFLLGWLKPTLVANGSSGLSLAPASIAPDCLLVTPTCAKDSSDVGAFSEFYLVENRTRIATANDKNQFGDGYLIWHIDSTIDPSTGYFANNNQYTDHKLIRLMEADGLEEIESGGGGDAGDYWSASQTFSSSSAPPCTYYDGRSCPFEVTNMSLPGNPMSLDVSYSVSSAIFCDRNRWVELDPLCAIIDCSRIKPGDDVINPDPTIRERIDIGTHVMTPQITVSPVMPAINATKIKQQIAR